jgi:hypothetical protein
MSDNYDSQVNLKFRSCFVIPFTMTVSRYTGHLQVTLFIMFLSLPETHITTIGSNKDYNKYKIIEPQYNYQQKYKIHHLHEKIDIMLSLPYVN